MPTPHFVIALIEALVVSLNESKAAQPVGLAGWLSVGRGPAAWSSLRRRFWPGQPVLSIEGVGANVPWAQQPLCGGGVLSPDGKGDLRLGPLESVKGSFGASLPDARAGVSCGRAAPPS